jgi:hypothetical protein
MASGADIAMESGNIVIMTNDLNGVLTAISLSRETVGKIRQNMFFALFYNVLGIPIAARALAFAGLILKPELAGLAMALSSVSVVTNSLTLKFFKPGKFNWISRLAPFVMVGLFLGVFIEFARFSSQMGGLESGAKSGPAAYIQKAPVIKTVINRLLVDNASKIGFAENLPKLFVGVNKLPESIMLAEGFSDLSEQGSVILGAKEAAMMTEEGLISGINSEIPDFFGLPKLKVVGILAPTGTILDEYHIFSKDSLEGLTKANNDFLITETPLEDLKLFYLYDSANIPKALDSLINPAKTSYTIDGTKYLSTVIGYDEAKMMIKEKLFQKKFDTIKDLFGNNIIITGLPKKTLTSLDMMHFVPREFKDNYLKINNL